MDTHTDSVYDGCLNLEFSDVGTGCAVEFLGCYVPSFGDNVHSYEVPQASYDVVCTPDSTHANDGVIIPPVNNGTVAPLSTVSSQLQALDLGGSSSNSNAGTRLDRFPLISADKHSHVGRASSTAPPLQEARHLEHLPTPINHAFLCMNIEDCSISPQIVDFANRSSTGSASHLIHASVSDVGCSRTSIQKGLPGNSHSCVGSKTQFDSSSLLTHEVQPPVRNTQSLSSSSLQGVTPSYIDLGNCDHECAHCGSPFWYGERLKGTAYSHRPEYHLCCAGGKFYMPPAPDPPMFLQQLLTNKRFMEHIRAYNQMFAMTSFGAKIDHSVNKGGSPYVFKVSGQVYHWIGSLCPEEGSQPRFLQLYFYDTHDEINNRMRNFQNDDGPGLSQEIFEGLVRVLDEHNGLVRLFRTARDRCTAGEIPGFKIRLYSKGGARGYELPTSDVLGGIVFEEGPNSGTDFDVIIEARGGFPKRINKLHQSYMSLQFPLLFVFGEPGFYPNLILKPRNNKGAGKKVSLNAYYKYQLHPRVKEYGLIFRAGRLFQQYVVAVFCAIEQARLDWIRKRQDDIRSDYLMGLYDAVTRGDRQGIHAGSMILLPKTFTGGPRYMYSHYLDALAICRSLGNPQYFVTFTCNVKWPEIKRYMAAYPALTPNDRADIICRVFQQKVNEFIRFIHEDKPFGSVTAYLYTIEFQKRGLPHCHTLVWVDTANKIKNATEIDNYISAEMPDPVEDPEGYKVITELMLHGPCGLGDPFAACTDDKGVCSKKFPKPYSDKTFFNVNGHTHYKRRATQVHYMKGDSRLDNGNVVPYNRNFSMAFHAHINVEYCGWSMLIKYLFKYISKGPDRILAKVEKYDSSSNIATGIVVDEIQEYVDSRFVCPFEACWRIFDYPIHRKEPAVQILNVHLENMQKVSFRASDRLDKIIRRPDKTKTTLTEWYAYNCEHTDGEHLTYLDFPSEFVWYPDMKSWRRRKIRTKKSIGRLTYIHPSSGDLFYFRMLLCHQKGCKSPVDVRTVNKRVYPTYRAACQAFGLLDDDREWDIALEEATVSSSSSQIRTLFAQILTYCEVSDPISLWRRHWSSMKDDIPVKVSLESGIPNYYVNEPEMQGHILYELQLLLNGFGKSLNDFGLPPPPENLIKQLKDKLLMEEKNYNRLELMEYALQSVPQLNEEQRKIYDLVMESLKECRQTLLFVYGHGGTGKTFLWKTIIASLRARGDIVLAVASSGIASLLLPAGRTAHSRFKLPLDLTDESVCHAKNTAN